MNVLLYCFLQFLFTLILQKVILTTFLSKADIYVVIRH